MYVDTALPVAWCRLKSEESLNQQSSLRSADVCEYMHNTFVQHSTAHNSSDSFPSYSPDSHHCSGTRLELACVVQDGNGNLYTKTKRHHGVFVTIEFKSQQEYLFKLMQTQRHINDIITR